jgi:hypothetical protein
MSTIPEGMSVGVGPWDEEIGVGVGGWDVENGDEQAVIIRASMVPHTMRRKESCFIGNLLLVALF